MRSKVPRFAFALAFVGPFALMTLVFAMILVRQAPTRAFAADYLERVRRGDRRARLSERLTPPDDEAREARSLIERSTGHSVPWLLSSGDHMLCVKASVDVSGTTRNIALIVDTEGGRRVLALSSRRTCRCTKSPKCWLHEPD